MVLIDKIARVLRLLVIGKDRSAEPDISTLARGLIHPVETTTNPVRAYIDTSGNFVPSGGVNPGGMNSAGTAYTAKAQSICHTGGSAAKISTEGTDLTVVTT